MPLHKEFDATLDSLADDGGLAGGTPRINGREQAGRRRGAIDGRASTWLKFRATVELVAARRQGRSSRSDLIGTAQLTNGAAVGSIGVRWSAASSEVVTRLAFNGGIARSTS